MLILFESLLRPDRSQGRLIGIPWHSEPIRATKWKLDEFLQRPKLHIRTHENDSGWNEGLVHVQMYWSPVCVSGFFTDHWYGTRHTNL